jgi:hypothetical protein
MPYGGITRYAAIQAQSFHTPGFTETDAFANGFGFAFGSRDATDTRSELVYFPAQNCALGIVGQLKVVRQCPPE